MADDAPPPPEEGNAAAATTEKNTTTEGGGKDGGEGAAPSQSTGGKPRYRNERDDTPIEELYDLTKPIKRVERPAKDIHEEELKVLEEGIEELKKQRAEVQTKIDDHMNSTSNSAASKERDALAELRSKKSILINEKREIRGRLNASKGKTERLFEDRKAVKQNVKFTKVEDIDAEIRRLQRKQETTSMSLQEEKRLIKEMDALQSSKKIVAEMKGKEQELESSKEQRKQITAELFAKDKEIDEVQKEIEEKNGVIKGLTEKESDFREVLQGYFDQRDKLREGVNEKIQEKNKLKDEFRAKNNEWYSYQRAVRAQRKMQYEEERRKREEEEEEYRKKLEEEELKKIPYEEEQALCEYLAKYLTKTYLDPLEKQGNAGDGEEKKDFVPVSDNPFANFKPMKKKGDEEVYLKMGKGKSLRERKSKKNKKQDKQAKFTLNMDTFDQFGLIGLIPPTSLEEVPKSVEDLKAKKEWYSKQPRGSVPTATEIRKKNEKEAARVRAAVVAEKESKNGKKKATPAPASFSLEEDFVPLGGSSGGAAAGAFKSSWGAQKETTSGADATPTPAEAAAGGEDDVEQE